MAEYLTRASDYSSALKGFSTMPEMTATEIRSVGELINIRNVMQVQSEMASNILTRIEDIASKLLGPLPEDGAKNPAEPLASCFVGEVSGIQHRIASYMNAIQRHLERLDKALS